ncbi:hypothetical protein, partial [Bacteroides caccae]|uniref:hypothetical protein n=1 Tax=Bacteroides caccae TaxID=47678 RepID=UPI00195FFCEF
MIHPQPFREATAILFPSGTATPGFLPASGFTGHQESALPFFCKTAKPSAISPIRIFRESGKDVGAFLSPDRAAITAFATHPVQRD